MWNKLMRFAEMIYLLIVIILLFGCNNDTTINNLSLSNLDAKKIELSDFHNYKLILFYFASPDCPLSNEYSRTIKELEEQQLIIRDIKIFVVFCGEYYSKNELTNFMVRNKLKAETVFDKDYNLKNYLKATATPEVFLADHNYEIIYHGCIDNKYVSVKEKRQNANEYYLADAIKKRLQNELPAIKYVKPVGCFIE